MNLSLLKPHAVVQHGVPLHVHGSAVPGTAATVTFRGQRAEGSANAVGRWRLTLPAPAPGGPDDMVVQVAGMPAQTIGDLLVGDVWVCAGQSNMEFPLRNAEDAEAELSRAGRPELRLFTVPRRVADTPRTELEGGDWARSSAETAADFSAVGHVFGGQLLDRVKIPIGLVVAAVGNTPGEAWMPLETLEADPAFAPILARWRRSLSVYPDPDRSYEKAFREWDLAADLAEREGRPIPGAHPKLIGPEHPWTPAGLYNGMIAPLTGMPIRGVIWAQGAGAPERAFQYRTLFRRLIRDWRHAWGPLPSSEHFGAPGGDFPFLFVQEAAFGPRRAEPGEHSWAELREAQAMALAEANTGMAVSLDCGDEKDIHPRRKRPVGERLALAARAVAYGERLVWSGPQYREMQVEGSGLRLRFDHVGGGLRTSDGGPPRGFAVSPGTTEFLEGNRRFVWAEARIEGAEVVVSSPAAARPCAARYAWAQNPDANLINAEGLPAAPFRTDDYPGVTVLNR